MTFQILNPENQIDLSPTYDKDRGNKKAEKYRKEYLEMFGGEPTKERLEIIRNSYIYIGDKYS